jgi:hypothetical protein
MLFSGIEPQIIQNGAKRTGPHPAKPALRRPAASTARRLSGDASEAHETGCFHPTKQS